MAGKEAKNSRKSEYPKENIVEQIPKRSEPPFPYMLKKSKEDAFFNKFFYTFKEPNINPPLLDVL